ncbi:MAG: YjbH domain-containing protein [Betaproteobacteria bacterium]|nr:YjbH domain-containing protein [Betaproteobacteria bacterium]
MLILVGFALPLQARAQVNDLGMGGILDIPTSRMQQDDTLTTTYSRKTVSDVYAIGYQILPNVEASFRYTIFNAREKSPIPGTRCFFGADFCDNNKDRSFEIKYRLREETEQLPEISVGIRDLLGTGLWGSEYVAASKRYGNLDLSLGLGWGRLADRSVAENPLKSLSSRFAQRSSEFGLGGNFSSSAYFRGDKIGLFGGFRYSIPKWRVDLLAAYNSDSYSNERKLGTIRDAHPLSYGVEWEATPGVRLTVSWQQGNSLALKLSAALDTAAESLRKTPSGFGDRTGIAPVAELEPNAGWWPRLVSDAEASGLLVHEMKIDDDGTMHLRYSNGAYQIEADAVRRVLSLVDQYAPLFVTSVVVTGDALGLTTHSIRYGRPDLSQPALGVLPRPIEIMPPETITNPDKVRGYRYPNGEWNLGLGARAYLFDPDFPLLYQVSLRARGDVDFGDGWGLTGTWVQSLKSQFGRITRGGNSLLPPVRTDLTRYLQEGASGIDELALVKRGKLGRDLYYQTYGGILEEMYSGAGAEVLWRRQDSPFAFGANINAVVQREFDKLFGVRNYKTITGHVSAYWATPIPNFDVALHAGQYLARDVGATLEVQKRFANGWSVGAFATLTNVPFAVFGEGSFDKGLIFNIPFDLYSPRNTRSSYRTILRSINRDGGRMLDNWPGGLWENMRRTHGDWLRQNRDRMIPE